MPTDIPIHDKNMKDRILQIMKQEKMTQQEFASVLEISPASLSSIFNGRTNPTNNHVQAIHRCFPAISVNWLMFGEGDMYVSASSAGNDEHKTDQTDGVLNFEEYDKASVDPSSSASFADAVGKGEDNPERLKRETEGASVYSAVQPVIKETIKYIDKPQRKITEIRIFYDDGTYETFNSR